MSLGIVGAGVIGAAWAARAALHGLDVAVYDPNPDAGRILDEVRSNARTAWDDLGLPLGSEGTVRLVESAAAAADGAVLVQESGPEDLDLKRRILGEIDRHASAETVIATSTSGLRPTDLQRDLAHPERLVVGHPFNPVYLLPLVEVCGGERTTRAALDTAIAFYESISMKAIEVRVEIDAFIADRLLEAVWREALWLVNDGVATTEEIDDVIRYGFGLRWAQMGLFETYRTAGGEGGMGHFIRQFGPALQWPWSKLTDVPELTDELVDRIEQQSDAQSGDRSVRELERARDRNLAAILSALEANDWGAGTTIAEQRRRLEDRRKRSRPRDDPDEPAGSASLPHT